ncbi:RimK/LysX family protein [Thaumasiovibrio subtropicus]|uniref:putative ATP-dependent zinc protease n=1 Tax=Thaumasiovibrio subtropicus TaxID=1891207 RepID=UPI000B3569CE|nr:RimK/LysX family protein [Thaumasiovibrio subtropicus]
MEKGYWRTLALSLSLICGGQTMADEAPLTEQQTGTVSDMTADNALTSKSDKPPKQMESEDRLFAHPTEIDDRLVLGRTELVEFNDVPALAGVGFPAKIDTGADSTSIHAENIRIIPREDIYGDLEGDALIEAIIHEYNKVRKTELRDREDITDIEVEFDIPHPHTGEKVTYRAPLLRVALVKSRDDDSHLYRPVVVMPMTIAGMSVETEVNLADRSGFSVPILIGKTFLRGNAWVDAGYDYLQRQSSARVIGRKERAKIHGETLEVSFSLSNRYSSLHAENIEIDEEKQQVRFNLNAEDASHQPLTVPLVRMVPFSDGRKPLVYVPVQFGADAEVDHIQVYLTDRSSSSSQLRLGIETLNRFFIIDLSKSYLTDDGLKTITTWADEADLFVISPKEQINIEGIPVLVEPTTMMRTSVLTVAKAEEVANSHVAFTLTDVDHNEHALTLPIESRLQIGETARVTVEPELQFDGHALVRRLALQESEDAVSRLLISPTIIDAPLLVNTRSEGLLKKTSPIEAGYVEKVMIDDLTFPAKLDTGADVSSLSATDIELFEQDGKTWVTFTYQNAQGDEKVFTEKVVNKMRVRPRPGEQATVRPVIRIKVRMGDVVESINVNLRDRSDFEYSMILGRNFLNNNIVVSSDERFIYSNHLNMRDSEAD